MRVEPDANASADQDLARQVARVLGQLGRGCGRPLGPSSLVTRSDAAAEARCDDRQLDVALARCRPVKAGRYTLYVWQDVLEALRGPPTESTMDHPANSLPPTTVQGLPRGGLRKQR